MADKLDDVLPPLADLRSTDKRTHDDAWAKAEDELWPRGMGFVSKRIKGAQYEQDREEVVALAFEHFYMAVQKGLAGNQETWETFFNEPDNRGD